MRFEIPKIFGNKLIVLLFATIFLINGYTFYKSCNHYIELKNVYDMHKSLDGEIEIERELLEREMAVDTYSDMINDLRGQALLLSKIGAFSNEDGFQNKTLIKSLPVYENMKDVKPIKGFYGGVELINQYQIPDLLVFLLSIIVCLLLVTQEKRLGYISLLRPMKKGGLSLYKNKLFAIWSVLISSTVILYATVGAIAFILFGTEGFINPIQSVFGFSLCPYKISIWQYLILFLIWKIAWAIIVGAAGMVLACFTNSILMYLGAAIVGLAISLLMGKIPNLWLETFSISNCISPDNIFNMNMYLNLMGEPFRQAYAEIIWGVIVFVIAIILGSYAFCKKQISEAKALENIRISLPAIHLPYGIFPFEAYKVLIKKSGIVCLLGLVIIQIISYSGFNEEEDIYVKKYADILQGEKTKEKDEFIKEETEYYNSLHEQLAYYYEKYQDDQNVLSSFTEPIEKKLMPEAAFEDASIKYESLRDDQLFVNESSYQRLYKSKGIHDDIGNTIKLILLIIVALSGVMAEEYETGTTALITSYGQQSLVRKYKISISLCLAILGAIIAYVPQYIAVNKAYGINMLNANIKDLIIFADALIGMPLWGLIVITQIIRLVIMSFITLIVLRISSKTKDTVLTICISSGVILVPLIMFYVLY